MNLRSDESHFTHKLLLVEPSEDTRALISGSLPPDLYQVIESRDGRSGWGHYQRHRPSAVLSALDLPGLSGLELFRRIRRQGATPFLFHTKRHDVREAVAAIRAGADDVLVLPEHLDLIRDRLEGLLGAESHSTRATDAIAGILGRSPAMRRIRERLAGAVSLRVPVLLHGPPGSGRDCIAAAMARADGSELVRIPHATSRPPERHDVGRTIYLDEIDRFPLALQARWQQQLDAIASNASGSPHRLIVSTTQELGALALQGQVDAQLAERLARFSFELPPLRRRSEDIALLSRALLERIGTRLGREGVSLSDQALALLRERAWPGNAAELEAALEQLVAFSASGRIGRRDVQELDRRDTSNVGSMRSLAKREQREELVALLESSRGNLAEVARQLGISRGAVIYRAQKYGLMAPRAKRAARAARSKAQ